jgi:hypothetical protein
MYRPIVLVALLVCQVMSAVPDVASVQNVAKDEAKKFLEKIPDGYEVHYGFKDRSEFPKTEIGIPLQVYTINPDSIDEKDGSSKMYLQDVNEWRVPVIVDNEYRALITVVKSGEKYNAVDFGGAVLAKRIGTISGVHPGCVNKIVRIYSIQSDYILADSAGVKGEDGIYIPVYQEQNGIGSLKKTGEIQLSRKTFLSSICNKHQQTKNSAPVRQ